MQTWINLVPPILFADLAFLRAFISFASFLYLLRYFSSQPIRLNHAPSIRSARNPAERFLPCHRLSIVFRA